MNRLEVTGDLAVEMMDREVQDKQRIQDVEKAIQTASKKPVIRKDIQAKVDKYLELHTLQRKLEARLKELKQDIEPYMLDKNLLRVEDSKGTGAIAIEVSRRAEVTANYSSYQVTDVEPYLDSNLEKMCITKVVDRDALEYLVRSGQVDRSVLDLKVTKECNRFTVKKY